jgi:hypothetical protein
MNLETIPDGMWEELAVVAMKRDPIGCRVDDAFGHIYQKYSLDKVKYQPNLPDALDEGWDLMVQEWESMGRTGYNVGESAGRADVQKDRVPNAVQTARLREHYSGRTPHARFQFVVSAGGGMVLLNRMRRACQLYIKENLKDVKDSVIQAWKVFGEATGIGRSDSCVVYLNKSYKDPDVVKVVNDYIWPGVKDLVDDQFQPTGFFRIDGKPLWALDLPPEHMEREVLRQKSEGSAGGLIGAVLRRAFEKASLEVQGLDKAGLIREAKLKAASLLKELYPMGV